MKNYEVRWHGRGGQGAKSASAVLAEVLFASGCFVQSFPEYGAERQGAPMKAYNRISDKPIRCHSTVKSPNLVVIVDPTMIKSANPSEGCPEDATYLVNTDLDTETVRQILGVGKSAKVIAVDATKITLEEFGQNRPNAPMLGALSKVFSDVPVEFFAEKFTKSMKTLPAKLLEANRRAIMRGCSEAVCA